MNEKTLVENECGKGSKFTCTATARFGRHESSIARQQAEAPAAPGNGSEAPGNGSVIDEAKLLKLFDGDLKMVGEVASLFFQNCAQKLSEIRQAVRRGDGAAVELAAHSIKGSALQFAAAAAAEAALQLERMGRNQRLDGAQQAFEELVREIERLERALASIQEKPRESRSTFTASWKGVSG